MARQVNPSPAIKMVRLYLLTCTTMLPRPMVCDEGRCVARFRTKPEHQGFPGHLHGGVISTLLDDAMDGQWGAHCSSHYALG